MQYLYMMATLVRENQMKKMVMEINAGLISVEQAMDKYNVASKESVIHQVKALHEANKRLAAQQSETVDLDFLAA